MATWQDNLKAYASDNSAGQKEIERAQQVYNQKKAAGDLTGAEAAHRWANQIRDAMGVSDQYDRTTGAAISNPVSYPAPQVVHQTVQSQVDPEAEFRRMQEELKQQQMQSRISGLDKARSNALAALDTEQSRVSPLYQSKRNQAAAMSDVGAMNFAQYMASRGVKGAAGAMPAIYRQAGLQGQIGALNQAEAQYMADIERQRGLINTGYETDVAGARADVESQAMQNLIDQWNQNRQFELQAAGLTGNLGGQRTLQGREFDWNRNPSNPQVQAQILANKAAQLELSAQEIKNSYLPDTLKLEAQRLEQQVKAGALDYDTALAQLNQIKAQIANVGASAANAAARLNYDQQQAQSKSSDQRISSYMDQINSLYVYQTKDEIGNSTGQKTMDSNSIKTYIKNLSDSGQVTDAEVKKLLAAYGFSF